SHTLWLCNFFFFFLLLSIVAHLAAPTATPPLQPGEFRPSSSPAPAVAPPRPSHASAPFFARRRRLRPPSRPRAPVTPLRRSSPTPLLRCPTDTAPLRVAPPLLRCPTLNTPRSTSPTSEFSSLATGFTVWRPLITRDSQRAVTIAHSSSTVAGHRRRLLAPLAPHYSACSRSLRRTCSS
ncbi:hypothetical protein U1Q18_024268, partial [Sarracenia purpurea var. burkii]